jgi:GH15 family glucan-1,4-alpha-glucosidase
MIPDTLKKSYKPIRDYGIVGDCYSAALVSRDGSVNWLCFPRFDSPSVFAAILDAKKGGRLTIAPQGTFSSTQAYLPDTNVLQTTFDNEDGVCVVTDCMPLYRKADGSPVEVHQLVRHLRCDQGEVTLKVEYIPRPDYGRVTVRLVPRGREVVLTHNGQEIILISPVDLRVEESQAFGTLTLRRGQEAVFVLSYRDTATTAEDDGLTAQQRIARTRAFWKEQVREVTYRGPWRDQVIRSYLVLHLLTHLPTGGIVAAATTSLPEEIGGVRNWDYRYTWLRDASLTIDALMCLEHQDEARNFFQWLSRVCAQSVEDGRLQIMYRVDATPDLTEEELPELEGYCGSRPVRIGNDAYTQFQQDVYGEVLGSAYRLAAAGEPISDDQWKLLKIVADQALSRWREPGSGIWEMRDGPYHFVHSKVMCWVALDRASRLAEETGRTGPESQEWRRAVKEIRSEVLQRGWSTRKQAFVQHYDTEVMDASNLLLLLVGFLGADDPRTISTVKRIREELGYGPFLRRYETRDGADGLTGGEGAFTLCSFWLAQALARMGEVTEAERLFEELLGYANHLGLYSEMLDPRTGEFLGNFPQAFTHIGLILAAQECGLSQ